MATRGSLNGGLTWRQAKIFRFIDTYMAQYGYAPTTREITVAAELTSVSATYYQLGQLQAKGYLRRVQGRKGGLAVVPARAERVLVCRRDLVRVLSEAEGFIGSADNHAFTRLAEAAGVA